MLYYRKNRMPYKSKKISLYKNSLHNMDDNTLRLSYIPMLVRDNNIYAIKYIYNKRPELLKVSGEYNSNNINDDGVVTYPFTDILSIACTSETYPVYSFLVSTGLFDMRYHTHDWCYKRYKKELKDSEKLAKMNAINRITVLPKNITNKISKEYLNLVPKEISNYNYLFNNNTSSNNDRVIPHNISIKKRRTRKR